MERVLLNKVRYLVERKQWDITIVTTDQKGRPPFYAFPKGVKMVDLGINYTDDNAKGALGKIWGYLKRRRLHRQRLTELLMRERADYVVSLYPSESSFIPEIKDGSRKVLELHFCKFFRLQYGRKGLLGLIDKWRTREDERIVRRFDKFVVLTEEDRGYWGNLPNMEVIPNAALVAVEQQASCEAKRVIAVGRLDYQKGFDRLIEVWRLVQQRPEAAEWKLDIFGQGEWQGMLQQRIEEYGLQESVRINRPTAQIGREYAASSMLVMSSNYEGFPMVMVEAMAHGLPVVTFDFQCGPRDIIRPKVNGIIVKNGDIQGLANALLQLMTDDNARKQMGMNARKVTDTYSETNVMKQWVEVFVKGEG